MIPEPVATYRLQMRAEFGFEKATGVLDYLADLGVSHVYTSPFLQATTGSTHGYDVVDPSKVNRELGSEESCRQFFQAIKEKGLGLMIDVVPNHMAIVGQQNPWWWDVLENGPSSCYANYFDVDWEASEELWPNKVLLPLLGDHYGRVLEKGLLQLSLKEGSLILHYEDHTFPIDPSSLAGFLGRVGDACHSELLAFLAQSHARLPRPTVTSRREVERRHREKAVLQSLLLRLCQEDPAVKAAMNAEIARLNHNADALDELIERQNYRLAFWRTASRDLGYRRFFDIKDLVGVRVEDPEVFRATHALPMAWFKEGMVQGLRIDHPDGLRNPGEYFTRLQETCPGAWIVAEKILQFGERVPSNWRVAGTTGYDFIALLDGLFVDPAGKEPLDAAYVTFIGGNEDFRDLVYQCKQQVLNELFGSEVSRLTTLFVAICDRHRRYRDYTRPELKMALCECAAFFPTYRSYVSPSAGIIAGEDENAVNTAIAMALEKRPDVDPELFHFLKSLLLLRVPGELEGELAMRFQQLTGPAMAKGLEDTALYRYGRFFALNEVGGHPDIFGISLEEFHAVCQTAQKERPLSLLAATTHDTKRSEDCRTRLLLLSEIPQDFAEAVRRWQGLTKDLKPADFDDPHMEYLFYQTLIGTWPIESDRILAYMEKAARECKLRTSWNHPNKVYEAAMLAFVKNVINDDAFKKDFEGFIAPLTAYGQIASLAQAMIRLTAPGIPDIYQGCELWNYSLVDPDNRRLVDFEERRRILGEISKAGIEEIMAKMEEGWPKMWLVHRCLHSRSERPDLFGAKSSYKALYANGAKAAHAVAFMRGNALITLAPRFVLGLKGDWADTSFEMPEGAWRNLLTDDVVVGGKKELIQELLKRFPVALFAKEA